MFQNYMCILLIWNHWTIKPTLLEWSFMCLFFVFIILIQDGDILWSYEKMGFFFYLFKILENRLNRNMSHLTGHCLTIKFRNMNGTFFSNNAWTRLASSFELILIAVKLEQEETLVDLVQSYHDTPCRLGAVISWYTL